MLKATRIITQYEPTDAAHEELTDLQHIRDGCQCIAPHTRRLQAKMAAEQTAEQRPPGAD